MSTATPSFMQHPTKCDKVLFMLLITFTLFGFVRRFFLVWLINHPLVHSLVSGGYTSVVTGGAHMHDGGVHVAFIVAAGIPMMIIAATLIWFVGYHWGHDFLNMSVEYSPMLRRFANWLKNLHHGWILVLVAIAQIPCIPFIGVSSLIAGVVRVPLKLFLFVRVAAALVVHAVLAYLGYRFGQQVLDIIDLVNKYSTYLTVTIIVVTFVSAMCQRPRTASHDDRARS